tara:strand:+ start:500 stop:760 length:261 start_codon:yes stop_codon:yes gene_type:complete
MKPTIAQLRQLIQETLAENWDVNIGAIGNLQSKKNWLDTHMGREYSDITLREAAEGLYEHWQPDPSDEPLAYQYKVELGEILGIED